MSSHILKNLKNLTQKDISLAGGKGASLGEMIKAGIPVPGGFVILTSAFEKFLKETKIDVEIEKISEKINIEDAKSVAKSSKVLNNLICQSKMPEDIEKEILAEFGKLKQDGASVAAMDSRLRGNDNTEYGGSIKPAEFFEIVVERQNKDDFKMSLKFRGKNYDLDFSEIEELAKLAKQKRDKKETIF